MHLAGTSGNDGRRQARSHWFEPHLRPPGGTFHRQGQRLRAQRSMPSRLNVVGLTKTTGCSLGWKNVRMSEIALSLRDPKIFEMLLSPSIIFAAPRYCRIAKDGVHERPYPPGEGLA